MKFLSALLLIALPLAVANANDIKCDGPNVRTVERAGKPPLKYFYFPAKNAKGTLVYVEGGPKSFSESRRTEKNARHELIIPENVNLIAFDYRGEGCNKVKEEDFTRSPGNFTSSAYAEDVTAIIQNAGLKEKEFIVTGGSYGTVVVQKYVSRLRSGDRRPTMAVVWSSVAGPYPKNCSQGCWVNRMFDKHVEKLPAEQQEYFKNAAKKFREGSFPAYLGYSGEAWNSVVAEIVEENGYVFPKVMDLVYRINVKKDNSAKDDPIYKRLVQLLDRNKPETADSGGVEKVSETSKIGSDLDESRLDSWILNTELQYYGSDISKTLPAPYSSTQNPEETFAAGGYESLVPIVFIQGELDPVTPYQAAYEAYRAKKAPEKYFAEVPDDSHNLSSLVCGPDFFSQVLILRDVRGALPKLKKCATLQP